MVTSFSFLNASSFILKLRFFCLLSQAWYKKINSLDIADTPYTNYVYSVPLHILHQQQHECAEEAR